MYVWLTPGDDLPALVVALAPFPEHDLGAVVDAAVVLVAVEGVEVEVDVVPCGCSGIPFPRPCSPSTAPTRPCTPGCNSRASPAATLGCQARFTYA